MVESSGGNGGTKDSEEAMAKRERAVLKVCAHACVCVRACVCIGMSVCGTVYARVCAVERPFHPARILFCTNSHPFYLFSLCI